MKTKLNAVQKKIALAQSAAADGQPEDAIGFIDQARKLKSCSLDTRKLLEKAREEFSIGQPPTGETFLDMAMDAAGEKHPEAQFEKDYAAQRARIRAEIPYTVPQVMANLVLMRDELRKAKIKPNLTNGPGWVLGSVESIIGRGIAVPWVELQNKQLKAALARLSKIGKAGVAMRHETGKPTWSALEEVAKIADTALANARGV